MVRPNRNSFGLVTLLIAMCYAGASQGNAAAYLLGFALASISLVSVLHTWANVRGLTLQAEPIRAAFAGDDITVHLRLSTLTRRGHPGLRIRANGSPNSVAVAEVSATCPQAVELTTTALKRGCFERLDLKLSTLYPLGFFTGTKRFSLQQTYFIYPSAKGSLPLPRSLLASPHTRDGMQIEGDDFAGTRPYQLGESQRQIDWKAAARNDQLLSKQWAADSDEILHLDWNSLHALEWEQRLCQLALWVLIAERTGSCYSLRLGNPQLAAAPPAPAPPASWLKRLLAPHSSAPGLPAHGFVELPAGRGDNHFHDCLRALALFPPAPALT